MSEPELEKLIAKWRKDADQYMRQVEEARQCAKEWDEACK